jgi:GTP-binding protein
LQVTLLDYSSYVGAIGIGRIKRGTLRKGMAVTVVNREGKQRAERITQVLGFHGLTRIEVESAFAGDIVAFAGIAEPKVSDTLCDPLNVEALPSLTVDEPTISMTFEVNTSPFLGREGKFVTSRQIRERLDRESIHNVALRVEPTSDPDKFVVFGRGELHLGVLLENMRREGYEMAVSRPRVVIKHIDGVAHEPYEQVTVDADSDAQGSIMSALGSRGADLKDMQADGRGRVRLDYMVPPAVSSGFKPSFAP